MVAVGAASGAPEGLRLVAVDVDFIVAEACPDPELAELLGEVVAPCTKTNLSLRVAAETGACAGKMDLARIAKAKGYDSVLDMTLSQSRMDRETLDAMWTAIGEYLMEHPSGINSTVARHMLQELDARLDKKEFENARIWYTMEDYLAARVALKNVLKDNSDNIYREDILYYSAMASYKYADMSIPAKQKERFLTFVDDYLNFIGEYPESSHRKELDNLYGKVKDKI